MPNIVSITVKLDDAAALAQLAALKKAAEGIATGGIDSPNLSAHLISIKQKMQSAGLADLLDFNLSQGQISSQIMLLKRKIQQAGLSDILDVNVSTASANAAIDALKARLDAVTAGAAAGGGRGGGNVPWWAAAAGAAAGGGFGNWGFLAGAAATKFSLFNGALAATKIPLLTTIGGVGLLAHAVVELGAVLIPATIGLGVFGVGAASTVQAISTQMKNLNTVSTALGVQMPGLSGAFQRLQDAVKPQVMQMFGDALIIANKNGGVLQGIATDTGKALDALALRFTVAVTHGNAFSSFLKGAGADVYGLGSIIGNLGGILGNVLKEVPGYARYFLDFGVAATHVAENLSSVAKPVMGLLLALHGGIVYTGLLTTGIVKLGGLALRGLAGGSLTAAIQLEKIAGKGSLAAGAVEKMAYSFSTAASFLTGPWGVATVAAAAGIGFLIYRAATARTAMQQWTDSLASGANQVTGKNIFSALGQEIDALNKRLGPNAAQGGPLAALAYIGGNTLVKGNPGAGITTGYGDYQALFQQRQQAIAQEALLRQRTDQLAASLGSVGSAQGLIALSGVTLGQITSKNATVFAQAMTAILATAKAYQEMGVQGGILGADMNALNIAGSDQVTQMAAVNKGWDATIGIVSGGQSSFIAFEQSLQAIGPLAKAAGASMNGINAPSLALRAGFQSAYTAGATLLDALRMMQSTSPGGFPPVTRAMGDVIAQFIPMAKGSSATRAELVSLAQETGLNVHNWSQLKQQFGDIRHPGEDLNKMLASMGLNIQDLQKDAAVLSNAMTSQVASAFSAARLQATGVNGAINKIAHDMTYNKPLVHADAVALYNDLLHAGYAGPAAAALISEITGAIFKIPKHTKVVIGVQDDASYQIQRIAAEIAGLQNRTITINTVTTGGPVPLPGYSGPAKAAGGVIGAASGGVRGNLVLVGERGPELVSLPVGSTVHSSADSQAMGWGGGPVNVRLTVSYDQSVTRGLGPGLLRDLRYTVNVEGGGNVQAALGNGY